MYTWTYCLWYLFTASQILSCGTLINIIMQNKESGNIDKNSVINSKLKNAYIIMQNKVSESMIKNSSTSLHFSRSLYSFHDETYQVDISVVKGQGFQGFHYYCSASDCNLTTRVSHRCNSQMIIIKTQTVSL